MKQNESRILRGKSKIKIYDFDEWNSIPCVNCDKLVNLTSINMACGNCGTQCHSISNPVSQSSHFLLK